MGTGKKKSNLIKDFIITCFDEKLKVLKKE